MQNNDEETLQKIIFEYFDAKDNWKKDYRIFRSNSMKKYESYNSLSRKQKKQERNDILLMLRMDEIIRKILEIEKKMFV